MDQIQNIIKLDPKNIITALKNTLSESSNSVLFGLQTIETVKKIPVNQRIEDSFLKVEFEGITIDFESRKQLYKHWLIKKGFEDLIKGINFALIEASFYIDIYNGVSNLRPDQNLTELLRNSSKKARKKHLPTLLDQINPYLQKSPEYEKYKKYEKYIRSMNNTRNCLVHRNGVVHEEDINYSPNSLKIEWEALKICCRMSGKEVELNKGTVLEQGGEIYLKSQAKSICFKIGEKINLDYKQFNELIITCINFGENLLACLPKQIISFRISY
jgi:hypothetical protein